jgi:hypothetical protein
MNKNLMALIYSKVATFQCYKIEIQTRVSVTMEIKAGGLKEREIMSKLASQSEIKMVEQSTVKTEQLKQLIHQNSPFYMDDKQKPYFNQKIFKPLNRVRGMVYLSKCFKAFPIKAVYLIGFHFFITILLIQALILNL